MGALLKHDECLNSTSVSTKRERIAELAKQSPQMAFTSLAYLIDIDWLKEAYRRTRKAGAVGVDGVTAAEYEQDLEGNLQCCSTCEIRHVPRSARATCTSRRAARPLRLVRSESPTLEDKILQRAVVMLLELIYEHDFLDCSYGFRPGRSAHQALQSFRDQLMNCRGGYVLEVDIRKFFDNRHHSVIC